MKKWINCVFVLVLALLSISLMIGCASGPKLGEPNALQVGLNKLPEVEVSGKKVKFEFHGDAWIGKVDGKEFLAGTLTFEVNGKAFSAKDLILDGTFEGCSVTLKQTHVYSTKQKPGIGGEVGWVKTAGPGIALEYKKGPPETLGLKKAN